MATLNRYSLIIANASKATISKASVCLLTILMISSCATTYEEEVNEEGVAFIKAGVFTQDDKKYNAYILAIDEKVISKKEFKNRQEIRVTPGEHQLSIACSYKKIVSGGNILRLLLAATGSWTNLLFLDDDEVIRSELTFSAEIGTTYDIYCQHNRYSWIEETESKELIAKSEKETVEDGLDIE